MLAKLQSIASWLAGIEIWVILLLVGISLVWSELLWVAVVAGLLFWLVRWIGYGHFSVRTPADLGVVCLVAISISSIIMTQSWDDEITQYLRLFTGVVLYYAIVNWTDQQKRVSALVIGIILGALGLCMFSIIGVDWAVEKFPFFPPTLYAYFLRLVSDTANPNVIAGSLVLLMPILFAMLIFLGQRDFKSRSERFIWWLAVTTFIIITLMLVLSLSRGAWIAGILSIMLVIGLRWRWGWLVFPLLGVAIWVTSSVISREQMIETLLRSHALVTMEQRISLWSKAILICRTFSYTGVGMGTFSSIIDIFLPSALIQAGRSTHAHNIFFQIAVDLGLPGLIAWLSILFSLMATSRNLYTRGRIIKSSWVAALGAGLLGSQLAMVIHGMLDVVIWGMVRPAPIVWAIWGVIALLGILFLRPDFPGKIHTDRSIRTFGEAS